MSGFAIVTQRRYGLLLGGFATLAGLVLFFFDPSQYHFYPLCVFHQTTGLLCPGCGSLRALHHLLHGNIHTAFRFNPLVVLCLPFVFCLAAACALRHARNQPMFSSTRPLWQLLFSFLLVALAFGVWRNLPGAPLAMLPP